jgi:hypothetical protein
MKQFALALLLAVGLILVGCGSNSNPANINGTWNATLLDQNNTTMFSFGTSLVVNGDGSLSISNFTFNSNSPCFVSGETATGSFTLSGNFNGNVNGAFGFVVKSGTPAGNTVTLTGTATGNTIKGNWIMNGTGCSGTGTFTMTKM